MLALFSFQQTQRAIKAAFVPALIVEYDSVLVAPEQAKPLSVMAPEIDVTEQ